MNTQTIETADGRFLKVEGGRNSVSVANAISRNPDPDFGPSLDEEPLPIPSLNEEPERKSHNGPLPLPVMTFEKPKRNEKSKRPPEQSGEAPLPLPKMF